MDTNRDEEKWVKLSNRNLKKLYIYFICLLFTGIGSSVVSILHEQVLAGFSVSMISIIGGSGMALMGATMFYLRKLYKWSINKKMSHPENEDERVKEMGVLAYYFLRPIFAICFSLLVQVGLKTSVSIVSVSELTLDTGMIYLTMVLSFFIGFASGDMVRKVESYSKDVVDNSTQNF